MSVVVSFLWPRLKISLRGFIIIVVLLARSSTFLNNTYIVFERRWSLNRGRGIIYRDVTLYISRRICSKTGKETISRDKIIGEIIPKI